MTINAATEDRIRDLIDEYELEYPNCTNEAIVDYLRELQIADLEYWINWFALD